MRAVSVFAVLALVLAVVILGVLGVVARELWRTIGKLNAGLRAANERLLPLTEELQAELAVTSVEVQGLTDHVANLQKERAAASKRRPVRRKR